MTSSLDTSQLHQHGNVPLKVGDELEVEKQRMTREGLSRHRMNLVLLLAADVDDLQHHLVTVHLAILERISHSSFHTPN